MEKKKNCVASYLDKDVVAFFNEGMLVCLYKGVVAFLDNNNKYDFDVYFLLSHPLV